MFTTEVSVSMYKYINEYGWLQVIPTLSGEVVITVGQSTLEYSACVLWESRRHC